MILQTQLKKKGNGCLGNPAIEMLDLSMNKDAADMDLHVPCLVNGCKGEDAGVLFRLNYSIHQHTGIGCDTSS